MEKILVISEKILACSAHSVLYVIIKIIKIWVAHPSLGGNGLKGLPPYSTVLPTYYVGLINVLSHGTL